MQEFYQTQPVLVRESEYHTWNLGIFDKTKPDRTSNDPNAICFITLNDCLVVLGKNKDGSPNYIKSNVWCQCIPYEGNELLLGTSYDPNGDRFSYKKYVQKHQNDKFKYGELVKLSYDDIGGTVESNAIYIAPMPNQEGYHIVIRVGTKDYVPEVTNKIKMV